MAALSKEKRRLEAAGAVRVEHDALHAAREGRTVAQEVEQLLEAAWEALEMAVALHAQTPGHALHPIPDPDPIPIPNPNPSPSPTPNPNPSPGLRSRAAALRGARAAGRRGDAERAARARQG